MIDVQDDEAEWLAVDAAAFDQPAERVVQPAAIVQIGQRIQMRVLFKHALLFQAGDNRLIVPTYTRGKDIEQITGHRM